VKGLVGYSIFFRWQINITCPPP